MKWRAIANMPHFFGSMRDAFEGWRFVRNEGQKKGTAWGYDAEEWGIYREN